MRRQNLLAVRNGDKIALRAHGPRSHFHPARFRKHFSFRQEDLALNQGAAGCDVEFSGGKEDRHKAAHDEVVDLLLGFIKPIWNFTRRDNRKVVADLLVVENPLVMRIHPAVRQNLGGIGVVFGKLLQMSKRFLYRRRIVVRQCFGIRTWIGQHLVAFIEALCNGKRHLGREPETAVGLTLQRRKIEKRRRKRCRFSALFRYRTLAT